MFRIIFLLFITLLISGTLEYESEKAEELFYCDMIKQKAWPAYNPDITCEVSK